MSFVVAFVSLAALDNSFRLAATVPVFRNSELFVYTPKESSSTCIITKEGSTYIFSKPIGLSSLDCDASFSYLDHIHNLEFAIDGVHLHSNKEEHVDWSIGFNQSSGSQLIISDSSEAATILALPLYRYPKDTSVYIDKMIFGAPLAFSISIVPEYMSSFYDSFYESSTCTKMAHIYASNPGVTVFGSSISMPELNIIQYYTHICGLSQFSVNFQNREPLIDVSNDICDIHYVDFGTHYNFTAQSSNHWHGLGSEVNNMYMCLEDVFLMPTVSSQTRINVLTSIGRPYRVPDNACNQHPDWKVYKNNCSTPIRSFFHLTPVRREFADVMRSLRAFESTAQSGQELAVHSLFQESLRSSFPNLNDKYFLDDTEFSIEILHRLHRLLCDGSYRLRQNADNLEKYILTDIKDQVTYRRLYTIVRIVLDFLQKKYYDEDSSFSVETFKFCDRIIEKLPSKVIHWIRRRLSLITIELFETMSPYAEALQDHSDQVYFEASRVLITYLTEFYRHSHHEHDRLQSLSLENSALEISLEASDDEMVFDDLEILLPNKEQETTVLEVSGLEVELNGLDRAQSVFIDDLQITLPTDINSGLENPQADSNSKYKGKKRKVHRYSTDINRAYVVLLIPEKDEDIAKKLVKLWKSRCFTNLCHFYVTYTIFTVPLPRHYQRNLWAFDTENPRTAFSSSIRLQTALNRARSFLMARGTLGDLCVVLFGIRASLAWMSSGSMRGINLADWLAVNNTDLQVDFEGTVRQKLHNLIEYDHSFANCHKHNPVRLGDLKSTEELLKFYDNCSVQIHGTTGMIPFAEMSELKYFSVPRPIIVGITRKKQWFPGVSNNGIFLDGDLDHGQIVNDSVDIEALGLAGDLKAIVDLFNHVSSVSYFELLSQTEVKILLIENLLKSSVTDDSVYFDIQSKYFDYRAVQALLDTAVNPYELIDVRNIYRSDVLDNPMLNFNPALAPLTSKNPLEFDLSDFEQFYHYSWNDVSNGRWLRLVRQIAFLQEMSSSSALQDPEVKTVVSINDIKAIIQKVSVVLAYEFFKFAWLSSPRSVDYNEEKYTELYFRILSSHKASQVDTAANTFDAQVAYDLKCATSLATAAINNEIGTTSKALLFYEDQILPITYENKRSVTTAWDSMKHLLHGYHSDGSRQVHYVTFATAITPGLELLQKSAILANVKLNILGLGDTSFDFGRKVSTLKQWVSQNYRHEGDIVVFMDAYDTVILPAVTRIPDILSRSSTPLLFCSEVNSYPDFISSFFYHEKPRFTRSNSPHLNSGCFMGEISFLNYVLESVLYFAEAMRDDQMIFTHELVKSPHLISLDTDCNVFVTGYRRPCDNIHASNDSVLCPAIEVSSDLRVNWGSCTDVAIMHFNQKNSSKAYARMSAEISQQYEKRFGEYELKWAYN